MSTTSSGVGTVPSRSPLTGQLASNSLTVRQRRADLSLHSVADALFPAPRTACSRGGVDLEYCEAEVTQQPPSPHPDLPISFVCICVCVRIGDLVLHSVLRPVTLHTRQQGGLPAGSIRAFHALGGFSHVADEVLKPHD